MKPRGIARSDRSTGNDATERSGDKSLRVGPTRCRNAERIHSIAIPIACLIAQLRARDRPRTAPTSPRRSRDPGAPRPSRGTRCPMNEPFGALAVLRRAAGSGGRGVRRGRVHRPRRPRPGLRRGVRRMRRGRGRRARRRLGGLAGALSLAAAAALRPARDGRARTARGPRRPRRHRQVRRAAHFTTGLFATNGARM